MKRNERRPVAISRVLCWGVGGEAIPKGCRLCAPVYINILAMTELWTWRRGYRLTGMGDEAEGQWWEKAGMANGQHEGGIPW